MPCQSTRHGTQEQQQALVMASIRDGLGPCGGDQFLGSLLGISPRHCRRVVAGDAPLTMGMARAFTDRCKDVELVRAMWAHVFEGTPLAVVASDDFMGRVGVDAGDVTLEGLPAVLRTFAGLVEAYQAGIADGRLEEIEAREIDRRAREALGAVWMFMGRVRRKARQRVFAKKPRGESHRPSVMSDQGRRVG